MDSVALTEFLVVTIDLCLQIYTSLWYTMYTLWYSVLTDCCKHWKGHVSPSVFLASNSNKDRNPEVLNATWSA